VRRGAVADLRLEALSLAFPPSKEIAMQFKVLFLRASVTATLLLGSAFCGGWKWGVPH
jgi:hypothetical protein